VCNLYSITTNQAAIIALFRVMNRYVGNLPPMPGVFPDYPAPVVRNAGAEHELTLMRAGACPRALSISPCPVATAKHRPKGFGTLTVSTKRTTRNRC
jgi:putative SOS response-associated peptidase YedK